MFTQLFDGLPDELVNMASLQRLVLNHVTEDVPDLEQARSLTSLEMLRGGYDICLESGSRLSQLTALRHLALTVTTVPTALLRLPQLCSLVLDGLYLGAKPAPGLADYCIHDMTQLRLLSKLTRLTVSRPC